jgi:predicted CoA-binding protein
MSDESSRMLARPGDDEVERIKRMVRAQRIAVVGLSEDPSRPSYGVARYLVNAGKEIVPVNPNHAAVLGLKCYARLEDVPGSIDLVDVFRRPQYCADVARSAVAVGAKGVWLQSGIRSPEAKRVTEEAGIDFVEDRCLMVEHMGMR